MTATPESLLDLITSTAGKDWLYTPSDYPFEALFTVDGKDFIITVYERTNDPDLEDFYLEDFPSVMDDLTDEELAQIIRAQALVDEDDAASDGAEWGEAQAAEFESGSPVVDTVQDDEELGGEG